MSGREKCIISLGCITRLTQKKQQNMAKMYGFLCALLMVCLTRINAKVLLVSMDGFRWDYINKAATPNFDRMAQEVVRVSYITSTFTTKTFPCHYSIATGN